MAAPGFCEADITANCLVRNTTLQIFIGDMAITDPFPVNTTDTLASLQLAITAATTGVGVTITVQGDSVFPLTCSGGNMGFLHLLVEVASTTQIVDALIVFDSAEGYNTIDATQFSCNLTPPPAPSSGRRRRKRGAFPPSFCVPNGTKNSCPDQRIVGGQTYIKTSENRDGCCYTRK